MSDMTPLTPLGAKTPRIDTHSGVKMTENTDAALASFAARRGQEDAARKALHSFTGTSAPAPGKGDFGKMDVFWTGPDQWMVMAPHATQEDLAGQIKTTAAQTASVTEQNDAWCRFDLTGPQLANVFERLCAVNLRDDPVGTATRTSIDHLGCFLLCRDEDNITVLGPRSSAGSLHHALLTAMHSAL